MWLAGLSWFLAPSPVFLRSPVLNPKPRGTFSWPTGKSPFTPFLPTESLLHSSKLLRKSSASLLHPAFLLPKPCGEERPQTTWFHTKLCGSIPCQNRMFPPLLHGCCTWAAIVSLGKRRWWRGANHLQALTQAL